MAHILVFTYSDLPFTYTEMASGECIYDIFIMFIFLEPQIQVQVCLVKSYILVRNKLYFQIFPGQKFCRTFIKWISISSVIKMQWKFSERVHSTLTFMGRISGMLVHTLKKYFLQTFNMYAFRRILLIGKYPILREKICIAVEKSTLRQYFACLQICIFPRNVIFLEMQSFSVDLISILEMFYTDFQRHTSHFFSECDKPLFFFIPYPF